MFTYNEFDKAGAQVPDFVRILRNAEAMWEQSRLALDTPCDASPIQFKPVQIKPNADYIVTVDNLAASRYMLDAMSEGNMERAQLVYMDPPFFTKTDYSAKIAVDTVSGRDVVKLKAFSDSKDLSMEDYLVNIAARIFAASELLADSGSMWIHLDHHAVHYVKVIADCILGGADHLLNEVIWQYKSGGSTKKRFSRKHDTLLFYAKNPKRHKFFPLTEKSYNRGKKPYRFKNVQEYEDEEGWHTIVNMKDVWAIDMVGRTSHERTGYATQKPIALLKRIIKSCTEEGDLCIDLYGGSGTLAAAAADLGRHWISIDENPVATQCAKDRLLAHHHTFSEISAENVSIDYSGI